MLMNGFKTVGLGSLLLAGLVSLRPAMAQDANFAGFTLDDSTKSASVTGSTGGSTSLPAITSDSDRDRNKCLGFGDPTPDHIMVIKQPLSQMTLKVESGHDTTLVVMGPDGLVLCGDDTGNKKDASISDRNWQPGTYKLWIGSMEPGKQINYRLTAHAK